MIALRSCFVIKKIVIKRLNVLLDMRKGHLRLVEKYFQIKSS